MDTLGLTGSRGWRRWMAIAATAAAALVAACGGGGGDEPASAGAATDAASVAWAAGPISGLGSIIVNGVRYDDSNARVEDDDGNMRGSADLKVGMVVDIRSSKVDDSTQRSSASQIRFGSEIVGPIESIATSSITVLGQPIDISSTTVFDDSLRGGLGALAVGTVVEVHALLDTATGRYAATRIEDKPAATIYRLRGVVSQLDATAKTFKLGSALISYGSATQVPSTLADGQRVRVTLQTAQSGGAWVAISVRSGVQRVDDASDGRIHGTVTTFRSSSDFDVNGMHVDASAAEFKPNALAVVQGVYVRVKGQVVNGVLVAREVKVDGRRSDDSIGEVEIHGGISNLDTGALTFTVRDVKVDYSGPIDWHDGSAANLANGKSVEVKGVWSSDHSTLKATKIEFESSSAR
jgi:Domain of unknown function (DUF5666)